MPRVLTRTDASEVEARLGGYNTVPPNWKEIALEEFLQSVEETSSVRYLDTRQGTLLEGKGKSRRAHLYHVTLWIREDWSGVATGQHYDPKTREWSRGFWSFAVCVHQRKELSGAECARRGVYHGGSCYHVYLCELCGDIYAVDSSG